jgi:cell division protein FtsI (penicillin-binding protein 3)
MQQWGKDNFRAFMTRIGFDSPLSIELPEKTNSYIPKTLSDVVAATASFGHGIAVTPLHMAQAMAAFVNDGIYEPPTLFMRTPEEAAAVGKRFVSPQTSYEIRELMRLNALEGSGTVMDRAAQGYRVGGKTGTADKVVNGRYVHDKNFNAFLAAFPMENPRYVVLSFCDEPKTDKGNGAALAATSAAPMVKEIISRAAPILGVEPNFGEAGSALLVSY